MSSIKATSDGSSTGNATPQPPKKVVVIGGGPVGTLAALYFSRSNWDVEVYELRPDPRGQGQGLENKSINLALSERGLNSLKVIDPELLEEVLKKTVPMTGRCIHPGKNNFKGKGGGESQAYDIHGRFIRSADRGHLNELLLNWAERQPNVKIFFESGLRNLDLDKRCAEFENRRTNETITVHADFFVGSDGAHSQTRRFLQRYTLMYYEQVYIDTLWTELEILPDEETRDFKVDGNHLHIWPRKDFMFIAIPSPDKTFTCTLFMPQRFYDEIGDTKEGLLAFFNTHFPDVIPLIGEEKLVTDYFRNSKHPLISIKCSPYHYKENCVIIGDAAHAMVPFYGQGMNAGFEDVRVLFEHIWAHPNNLSLALTNYTHERKSDAHTINDLAMQNYTEMRDKVTFPIYKFRKATEEFLDRFAPWVGVRTLYSYVSFSNVRYSEVVQRVKWQQEMLGKVGGVLALSAMVGLAIFVRRMGFGPADSGSSRLADVGRKGLGVVRGWLKL